MAYKRPGPEGSAWIGRITTRPRCMVFLFCFCLDATNILTAHVYNSVSPPRARVHLSAFRCRKNRGPVRPISSFNPYLQNFGSWSCMGDIVIAITMETRGQAGRIVSASDNKLICISCGSMDGVQIPARSTSLHPFRVDKTQTGLDVIQETILRRISMLCVWSRMDYKNGDTLATRQLCTRWSFASAGASHPHLTYHFFIIRLSPL